MGVEKKGLGEVGFARILSLTTQLLGVSHPGATEKQREQKKQEQCAKGR